MEFTFKKDKAATAEDGWKGLRIEAFYERQSIRSKKGTIGKLSKSFLVVVLLHWVFNGKGIKRDQESHCLGIFVERGIFL